MLPNLKGPAKAFLFFGISFGLTLIVALLYPLLGEMTLLVHTFTPTVSVVLMMLVMTRDGYSRAGWAVLGLHRLGMRYWGVAFLVPVLAMGALYAIAWSSTVGRFALPHGFTVPLLATNLSIGLGTAIAFAFFEEVGFRGYALPHLMVLGPTRALVLSGLMFALWHFPVMLLTPVYPVLGSWLIVGPTLLLTLTFAGVFYGYLRLSSESIWPSTLAHGVINTSLEWFALFTATASPRALESLVGERGLLTLAATALIAGVCLFRLRRLSSTSARRTPEAPSGLQGSADAADPR